MLLTTKLLPKHTSTKCLLLPSTVCPHSKRACQQATYFKLHNLFSIAFRLWQMAYTLHKPSDKRTQKKGWHAAFSFCPFLCCWLFGNNLWNRHGISWRIFTTRWSGAWSCPKPQQPPCLGPSPFQHHLWSFSQHFSQALKISWARGEVWQSSFFVLKIPPLYYLRYF